MTPRDLAGMLGIALALAVLLWVVSRLARSGKFPPETARKSVHAGMGLTCLTLPWLFSSVWPVLLLGGLATAALLAVRSIPALRQTVGASVHGVERRSGGEIMFPIAVVVLFVLAGDRREFFLIPLLVLTVADALGAVVGTRYGQVTYNAWKGSKSIEGSFLFFLSAFLCCHLVLLLATPTPRAACVWMALSVALLATAIEGALGDGWDNLLVPLGTFLVLDQLDGYTVETQAAAAGVFIGIFSLLWFCRRWSTLDGGAILAGTLYGAACLAWGGYGFLAAPLGLFCLHLLVTRILAPRRKFRHAADAILFLALPVIGVLALHHQQILSLEVAFTAHTAVVAAQMVMMHSSTRRALGLKEPRVWFGLGKALVFIIAPALVAMPTCGTILTLALIALLLPVFLLDAFRHRPDLGPEPKGHHIRRALGASLAAVLAIAVMVLMEKV